MAKLGTLEFTALDISGKNYLPWMLDAEIHLDANGLGDTIKVANKSPNKDKAKAMIFLRRHLHEGLKNEYLTVKDPLELWNLLKERFDHLKTIILPQARYAWMHLRLQDFKSVSDYNSALFKICSQLKLCGENISDKDMLEKTFSTFHASNVLLQQYREKGFQKYSELVTCLLLAEQNNELLLRNHETRPTGSNPFPEVNVITHNSPSSGRRRGRGRGRGSDRQPFHGRSSYRGRGHMKGSSSRSASSKKWNNEKGGIGKSGENICYRCGGKDHWSRTCRTPKHLTDLYQESVKNKKQKVETNFAEMGEINHGLFDATHLDVADFFVNPEVDVSKHDQFDATEDVANFFVNPEGNVSGHEAV